MKNQNENGKAGFLPLLAIAITLTLTLAMAQAVRDVVVSENGTLVAPSNLWATNAAGMASALTNNFAPASHATNTNNPHAVTKTQISLGNVEDTALSTWAGSTNITTVGTISGNLSVNGNTKLGDASGDTVTITAGTVTAANATGVGTTAIANVGTLDGRYIQVSPLIAPISTQATFVASSTGLSGGTVNSSSTFGYNLRANALGAGNYAVARFDLPMPVTASTGRGRIDFTKKLFFGAQCMMNDSAYLQGTCRLFIGATASFLSGQHKSITGTQSDNVLTSAAHGFSDGNLVVFPALTGGAGITAASPGYYVVNKTTDTFQVALTSGGAAVDFTTDISAGTVQAMPIKAGVGWRWSGLILYATMHDGISYYEVGSASAFSVARAFYLAIVGNGSGGFTWYVNGSVFASTSAGPTALTAVNEGYMILSTHTPTSSSNVQDNNLNSLTFGCLP